MTLKMILGGSAGLSLILEVVRTSGDERRPTGSPFFLLLDSRLAWLPGPAGQLLGSVGLADSGGPGSLGWLILVVGELG